MTADPYEATGGEPRIAPLGDEAAFSAAAGERIPEAIADMNIFRTLLHRPNLAKQLSRLGGVLLQGDLSRDAERTGPVFDSRLRELAIMRVAWLTGSAYEWTQHWRIARTLGVSEADLIGVRDWLSHEGYGELEQAVLAAVDETLAGDAISDRTWGVLASHIAEDALLELTVAIGHWLMVSTFLRSLRVPIDEDLEAWPPDGVAPGAGPGTG